MEILRVPLINANEDELEITEVFVKEGEEVKAGDPICVVESTKATTEVEAPRDGFVRRLQIKADTRARVGSLVCALTDTADEPLELDEANPKADSAAEGSFEVTRKARILAEQHGIDLQTLGITGIIRVKDIHRAIGAVAPAPSPAICAEEVTGERLAVFGAGGHARALVDLIRSARPDIQIVGAVDDDPAARDVFDVPLLGSSERLAGLRSDGVRYAGLGVGAVTNNALRITLYERLVALGFTVPSFVHRRAIVEPSARMGMGNQIFPGAVVGSNVRLGENTIINSGVVLSHDCAIGSHAHITPGAILAGSVTIGSNTVVGMGVTVYLGVTIGKNVLIANGCHIMHDVPDGAVVRASQ